MESSIEIGSWELMKRLVAQGMGIGVIPKEYAEKEIEEGLLQAVETDPPLSVRSVGMVLPKNTTASYALRMFLQLFGVKL
jgi:DNA-binding transcriptional LysR family regulator